MVLLDYENVLDVFRIIDECIDSEVSPDEKVSNLNLRTTESQTT